MQCLYSKLYGNAAPSSSSTAAGDDGRSPGAAFESDAKRVETELPGFSITAGAISTLPVDSVVHKAMGRWHHAVAGSQEEVVRYLRSVEAEFRIPGERTSDGKLKGSARAHERTSARAHERTSARAHERTSARAHVNALA